MTNYSKDKSLARISARTGASVFPNWELGPILQAAIDRIDSYQQNHLFSDEYHNTGDMALSGRNLVAERAAHANGYSRDTYLRYLYAIIGNERITSDAERADGLLLAANINCEDIDELTTLPGSIRVAEEMVAVHYGDLPAAEQKELARQLYGFSVGYAHGLDGAIHSLIITGLRRFFGWKSRHDKAPRGVRPLPVDEQLQTAA